jgi:hypothetical protein
MIPGSTADVSWAGETHPLPPAAVMASIGRIPLTRVNSTNVLDEGLRIEGIGRRMNSKVNQSNKVCIECKRGGRLGLLSICPLPASPGPYI